MSRHTRDIRLPPLPGDALTEAQERAAQEFSDARGYDLRGPFIGLLRSPELLTRIRAVGDYLRFSAPLPGHLRELAILITARHWSQPYEWNAHYSMAIAHGLARDLADAVGRGQRPDRMSPDEALVYQFCIELLPHGGVTDETYRQVESRFGESVVIDTIGLVGYYTLLALVLNVARTPVPSDAPHPLPRLRTTRRGPDDPTSPCGEAALRG